MGASLALLACDWASLLNTTAAAAIATAAAACTIRPLSVRNSGRATTAATTAPTRTVKIQAFEAKCAAAAATTTGSTAHDQQTTPGSPRPFEGT